MIRMTRMYCFGGNNWNILKVGERAGQVHKQIFLKCSVFAGKEDEVEVKRKRNLKNYRLSWVNEPKLAESFAELKNSFFREIFLNQAREARGLGKREFALRTLFDNMNTFRPPEIIMLLKVFAQVNSRPIKSLQVLGDFLLAQADWNYTILNVCDLLYALTKLSYRNEDLLNLACKHLKNHYAEMTPKQAINILLSLGELRHRDVEVIENLTDYIFDQNPTLKQSLGCLKSYSILNYNSERVSRLVESLVNYEEVEYENSKDYVNFIWYSVILNKEHIVHQQHFSQLLSNEFISRIISNYPSPSEPIKSKLLQINAVARQIENYDGCLLQTNPKFKFLNMALPHKTTILLKSVQQAVSFIVPKTGAVRTLVQTGAGFYLDIEYVMDVKNRNDKIAIMILNYNDVCSDGQVTGIPAFKERILRHKGYKTLFVSYSEYDPAGTMADKVAYMRKRLKEVLEEDQQKSENFTSLFERFQKDEQQKTAEVEKVEVGDAPGVQKKQM